MGLSLERKGSRRHEAAGVFPALPSPTLGGPAPLPALILAPKHLRPAMCCCPEPQRSQILPGVAQKSGPEPTRDSRSLTFWKTS